MGFLRRLLGLIFILIGLLFAAVAVALYFQEEASGSAWAAGSLALLFLVVGKLFRAGGGTSSWKDDPATDRQKEFANDLGIKYPKNISKGELSALISEVTGR